MSEIIKVIPVIVLPGGLMPSQGKPGKDVGFDVHCRAILKAKGSGDPIDLWNFVGEAPEELEANADFLPNKGNTYFLQPWGPPILIGLGFKFFCNDTDWYAELCPRSSTAMLEAKVENWMEKVPIDPQFKSEPKAFIRNCGQTPIEIYQGRKLAQLVFHYQGPYSGFFRPTLISAIDPAGLAEMEEGSEGRGSKWNGSSKESLCPSN